MKIFLFGFILFSISLPAQQYPLNFDLPLKEPLYLNGTFAELRSNHFHSGLDIGTKGKEGWPIYAPYDGEVNRIKISTFGYGKALYIKHSNGFTTVYAHLSSYSEPLEKYIQKRQYEQKKFEIEIFPLLKELPVKKGDLIGYTGNSGGSGGPHLHYEFRNTKTEEIINPFLMGVHQTIKDTQAPILNGVMVYPIGDSSVVNASSQPINLTLHKQADGSYISETIYANSKLGFAVNSYDTTDKSYAKNGLYYILQQVNGRTTFEIKFDVFSFDQTRFINHFVDYKILKTQKNWYQKLFTFSDLPLSMVKTIENKGILDVHPNLSYNVTIQLSDFNSNTTKLHIPVVYKSWDSQKIFNKSQNGKFIDYLKDYLFSENNLSVGWDARTFYQDVYLNIEFNENEIHLHEDVVPVHKNIDLRINVSKIKVDKNKAFIGLEKNGKVQYFSTWKKNNDFRIRTKTLGTYKIFEDFQSPVIAKPNFKNSENLKNKNFISVEISDKLSGIGTYNGFINDNWVLFEYDYKTGKLVHRLNKTRYKPNQLNRLKVVVTDKVGNSSTFESSFFKD